MNSEIEDIKVAISRLTKRVDGLEIKVLKPVRDIQVKS